MGGCNWTQFPRPCRVNRIYIACWLFRTLVPEYKELYVTCFCCIYYMYLHAFSAQTAIMYEVTKWSMNNHRRHGKDTATHHSCLICSQTIIYSLYLWNSGYFVLQSKQAGNAKKAEQNINANILLDCSKFSRLWWFMLWSILFNSVSCSSYMPK